MEFYLARHARAADGGERALTESGREDARRVGRALAAAGVQVAAVWHSGKLRARETADLLAGSVGVGDVELEERADLAPLADPSHILDAIEDREGEGAVLVVGHLPHVERLASLLLAEDVDAEVVEVAKGGVMRFLRTGDGRHWRLTWYVTPALVRSGS